MQLYVKYNPYRMKTDILANGKDIPKDSAIYRLLKGKRLQEWISDFPRMLVDEYNAVNYDIEFHGLPLDYDDFEDAFRVARDDDKIIKEYSVKFVEGKNDKDITEKVVSIFQDLKDGPLDDFRDPRLIKAFDRINEAVFPIDVIATMSSGKSTLINSLLRKKLMPSKNEACTATVTEILDTDSSVYSAEVFDTNGEKIENIENLTYEKMDELNSDDNVSRIFVKGDIPFITVSDNALCLLDTPGPNNSQNQEHKRTTYNAINSDSNNLILYVLNATQLGTNDDDSLLNYVAEQIKKGGKQARDRFLFVINKMDAFNPEEENIEAAVNRARKYLSNHGIDDPQIFPCSAYTALNIRTYLSNIDIDNLTRAEEKALPSAAKETIPLIDKFNDYESMHLEKYSTLSPSAQEKLDYELSVAEKNGDTKAQALIHCGIYSIEQAIIAYVTKYARTKKVKDLVETFEEVLDSNQIITKTKTELATNKEVAEACSRRRAVVEEKINGGEEAEEFKEKVNALDPMPAITKRADELKEYANSQVTEIFKYRAEVITDRNEAIGLVKQFAKVGSDALAEVSTELESCINNEVIDTGNQLLRDYTQKLTEIDESVGDDTLDFSTADLIKGVLSNMKAQGESRTTTEFVSETIDEYGETTEEEKTYYEKVGQKEEKVAVGSHMEKTGTKKVKTGTHKEQTGTRRVKNPDSEPDYEPLWFGHIVRSIGHNIGAFFSSSNEPEYIDEPVYKTVTDYREEDVYKSVTDYKTVMRDVFAERKEKIEKFSIDISDLQVGLLTPYRKDLEDGFNEAIDYAGQLIDENKEHFGSMFDKLDDVIKEKYAELDAIAADQETNEEELKKNEELLTWIENNQRAINEALDM